MMDTILNLGINDEVVEALSEKTGNQNSHRIVIDVFFKCTEVLLWESKLTKVNTASPMKSF